MPTFPDPPSPNVWGTMPSRGRLMGIDFGTKRIGLAVSDAAQSIASPVEMFESRNAELDRQQYRRFLEKWEPRALVVGLPLYPGGDESAMSARTREHAAWLHECFGLPCAMWDERFTSHEAEATQYEMDATKAQRKSRVDALAATAMLQAYLDRPRETA